VSVRAYHSFAGEVEASNTPAIRRLTSSRRHQLSPIAPGYPSKTVHGKAMPRCNYAVVNAYGRPEVM
jgi:hypothetical protein